MKSLIDRIADLATKRARYVHTVSEIRSMPLDVALDLDIDRDNAERIAARAVYGR